MQANKDLRIVGWEIRTEDFLRLLANSGLLVLEDPAGRIDLTDPGIHLVQCYFDESSGRLAPGTGSVRLIFEGAGLPDWCRWYASVNWLSPDISLIPQIALAPTSKE